MIRAPLKACGSEDLGKWLRQLSDYLDEGCPQVKKITLNVPRSTALAAGVTEENGKYTYRGREVIIVWKGKK